MRKKEVFFNKKNGGIDDSTTIIASETIINGDFATGDKRVFINGNITGSCESSGELIIGPDAVIDGNITGKVIIIQGKVTGDISARSRLELLTTADVRGNITTKSLVVDEDAVFVGQCFMSGKWAPEDQADQDEERDLEFIDVGDNSNLEERGK